MSTHPFLTTFADRSRTLVDSQVPEVRLDAQARLEKLKLPTRKTEAFRFFDVGPIVNEQWAAPTTAPDTPAAQFAPEAQTSVLVVDGAIVASQGQAAGMRFGAVSSMNAADKAVALSALGIGLQSFADDAFYTVNDATFTDPVAVVVDDDVAIDGCLHIVHVASPGAACTPRIAIVVGSGSKVTVVEEYRGSDDGHFTSAVCEVVVGASANLHHVRIQQEGSQARHVSRVWAKIGEHASYDSVNVTLAGRSARNDIWVSHEGPDGWSRLDGLALVDGESEADTHTVIDNRKPRCRSHQLHKCVVADRGHAVFNGKILVQQDAQQIDAYQLNRNLLLSAGARVNTKPQLEILADDVQCTHGATVGQLDDDQLFYLESRGLSPAAAKATLTYAFAAEVIESIRVPSIAESLQQRAHQIIGQHARRDLS